MSCRNIKFILLVFGGVLLGLVILTKHQKQLNFIELVERVDYSTNPHSMPFLHSVIPKPVQMIVDTLQNLYLRDGVVIYYDRPQLKNFLYGFSRDLMMLLGVSVRIVDVRKPRYFIVPQRSKVQIPMRKMPAYSSELLLTFANSKELKIFTNTVNLDGNNVDNLSLEAYQIRSIPSSQQIIISGTETGIFYATRTLLQIFYQQLYRLGKSEFFPKLAVLDTPRFAYRGLHLDVARHFFPLNEVKRLIRLMSFYKLNKLHLHLSDDQGWRVELAGFPRLTEIGSVRRRTLIGRDRGSLDKNPRFEHRDYGGFYSREELRELVRYAKTHAVELIPEIDMPSHTAALIASYPFLACDSTQPYEVSGLWRGAKFPLCLGRERTYKFLFQLLDAISETFPGKYLHIGQDEVQTVAWEKCPDCQQSMKRLGLRNLDEYRDYFRERISNYVRVKLKRMPIIWDDNFNPAKVDKQTTLMVWKNPIHIKQALRTKIPVIVADNKYFYLNYYQTKHYHKEPISFMRTASMRNLYSYMLPSKALGAQVLLWTEYIKDFKTLQVKLLPRMIAGAESFWTVPTRKNYTDFLLRLRVHDFYLSSENFEYKYLD